MRYVQRSKKTINPKRKASFTWKQNKHQIDKSSHHKKHGFTLRKKHNIYVYEEHQKTENASPYTKSKQNMQAKG